MPFPFTIQVPAPKSSKPNSVSHKVLATPELLEAILLRLPLKHVLRIQSVSKGFQDATASSPQIQKALFLRPCGEPVRLASTNGDFSDYMSDLEGNGLPNTRLTTHGTPRWTRAENGQTQRAVALNPFLSQVLAEYQFGKRSIYIHLPIFASHPSWLDMLLTQPPTQRMVVKNDDVLGGWDWVLAEDTKRGIRLRDVLDHLSAVGDPDSAPETDTLRIDNGTGIRVDHVRLVEGSCAEMVDFLEQVK